MDDSALHFNFEGHLLLIDKDMKFPVALPIFKEGLGCAQVYGSVKMALWQNNAYFSEQVNALKFQPNSK